MKKWMLAALVAAGLTAAGASAQPPGTMVGPGPGGFVDAGYGPPAGGAGYGYGAPNQHLNGTGKFWSRPFFGHRHFSAGQNLTQMPTLPVFMAAPWYNYWPYDGHFQTVAPIASGAFYPPPTYTGNAFLPGRYPGYVPGAGVPTFPGR